MTCETNDDHETNYCYHCSTCHLCNDDAFDKLTKENERLKELLNPRCSGDTGSAVNDTGWFLNDWLSSRGEINGYQFNSLKEMFCKAVEFYVSKANK